MAWRAVPCRAHFLANLPCAAVAQRVAHCSCCNALSIRWRHSNAPPLLRRNAYGAGHVAPPAGVRHVCHVRRSPPLASGWRKSRTHEPGALHPRAPNSKAQIPPAASARSNNSGVLHSRPRPLHSGLNPGDGNRALGATALEPQGQTAWQQSMHIGRGELHIWWLHPAKVCCCGIAGRR